MTAKSSCIFPQEESFYLDQAHSLVCAQNQQLSLERKMAGEHQLT